MEKIEFYIYEDELWCKTAGRNFIVTEKDTELIDYILTIVRERYPKTYASLQRCYEKSAMNVRYYQFLMARRFCKCNFGSLDPTEIDLDSFGCLHFEKVQCPLRGECRYEGVICNPRFNSTLSDAERRVMKLYYEGAGKEDIAEQLYISPNTVKNHIKSAYCKLGVHEKAEFVRYAEKNHIFDNDNV